MSKIKKILLIVLLFFVAIQFMRPARNSDEELQAGDLISNFNAPQSIARILKESCYDCHSNNTNYPWYSNIQPFGWLLAKHIRDGKSELNFHDFMSYSKRRKLSKLKSVQNSIKDGSMPLSSYILMHQDAKLSTEDQTMLINWTTKTIDSLKMVRNKSEFLKDQ